MKKALFSEEMELKTGTSWEMRIEGLLTRGVRWLATIMVVVPPIWGLGNRFGREDLLEEVMAGNFGKQWRLTMQDASQTNQVQFQRMRAIHDQVNGGATIIQPPATESSPVD